MPHEALTYFEHWLRTLPSSVKTAFKKYCGITPFWMPTVLAYFEHPYTTGYIEGVNRVIDDLHRAGRGYSFDVIRGKLLLSPKLEVKTFRRRGEIWRLAIIRCHQLGGALVA
jgi:transposase